MVMQPESSVESSTYLRVAGGADFQPQINADGEFEVSFDRTATLALTIDAAEKFYSMLGDRLPELRERAAANLT
jgi:hypothetical protein